MRFTQVKRDKNVNFLCVFEENEKWRSFTAEKTQNNKTSNHVKYVCSELYFIAYKLYNCTYSYLIIVAWKENMSFTTKVNYITHFTHRHNIKYNEQISILQALIISLQNVFHVHNVSCEIKKKFQQQPTNEVYQLIILYHRIFIVILVVSM